MTERMHIFTKDLVSTYKDPEEIVAKERYDTFTPDIPLISPDLYRRYRREPPEFFRSRERSRAGGRGHGESLPFRIWR